MMGRLELVPHRVPTCSAGFSAVLASRYDGTWGDDRPSELELRCWTCGTVVRVRGFTYATDDPPDDTPAPAEHRPWLSLSGWRTTDDYPASVPPERVGRVVVHAEQWLSRRDPFAWLVADRDGNVLGSVNRYMSHGRTMDDRYRWGSLADAAGHGEGFKTRDAAVRAVARATVGKLSG